MRGCGANTFRGRAVLVAGSPVKTCVSGATGSVWPDVAGALGARGDDSRVTAARLGERAGLMGGLQMAERLLGRRFAAGG